MSDFLDDLRVDIGSLSLADGWSSNLKDVGECQGTLDALGDNARRMIEIGILQDELIKLGFKLDGISRVYLMLNKPLVIKESHIIGLEIYFNEMGALLKATSEVFSFASPSWQEDLINRVKELIK